MLIIFLIIVISNPDISFNTWNFSQKIDLLLRQLSNFVKMLIQGLLALCLDIFHILKYFGSFFLNLDVDGGISTLPSINILSKCKISPFRATLSVGWCYQCTVARDQMRGLSLRRDVKTADREYRWRKRT